MNKTKTVILVGAVAASLLSGCSTVPQTQQRVVTAAKAAAYVGTAEYLSHKPLDKPKFAIASAQLHALTLQSNIDLVTIIAIVNQLPVKELKSPRAQIIVTAGTLLLVEYGQSLPVDKLNNLKPVAGGIADGIDLAIVGVR